MGMVGWFHNMVEMCTTRPIVIERKRVEVFNNATRRMKVKKRPIAKYIHHKQWL